VIGPKESLDSAEPGDVLFFSGGPACHSCGNGVGHVGIYLGIHGGEAQMFQHTSRASLGITRQKPTEEQMTRFVGAWRLLPLLPLVGIVGGAGDGGVVAVPVPVVVAPKPGEAVEPAERQVWRFKPVRDDSGDIICHGLATSFDDHDTRTGIHADRAGLVACSLPRGLCKATEGSGFEGVPDLTLVRVYCIETRRIIVAPVIDEGPAWVAEAGTGKPGSAMIDLTPAALAALGLKPGQNAEVVIRVLANTRAAVLAGRRGEWK
jgi:hypothetical protein